MSLSLRSSAPASRLEALQTRHAALETELFDGQKHRSTSDLELARLKKQKLKLKEEIAALEQSTQ